MIIKCSESVIRQGGSKLNNEVCGGERNEGGHVNESPRDRSDGFEPEDVRACPDPCDETQPEGINHTILVVEDEMLLRLDLAHQIRSAGFDVIEADSGDEALTVLEAERNVDLILTDIRMPGQIDGAGLASSVRGQTQNIKIVVLSAYIDTQQELPVDAAFAKPVRMEALLAKVRSCFLRSVLFYKNKLSTDSAKTQQSIIVAIKSAVA
jgi:CheY-like chemotaxis protein